MSNPKLWHPNTPVLYTLATEVQDGSTAVDNLTTRIGIRRIGWSHSGGLTINGARWKALGVNALEETYGLGNAVSDQSIYYDVKRIRDAGLTFIRGAHYPHAPAFYDACDALGVLVMDAQTGWQYFSSATAFVNASYQELRDMIRRDRNHPSIVVWEANLNESQYTDAWAQMAHNIVHAEYPGDQAFSGQFQFTRSDIFIEASQHNVRTSTDTRPIIINEYGDWDYGGVSSTSRQAREAGDTAMLTATDNVQDGQGKNIVLSWFSADGYWQWSDYGGYKGISRRGWSTCTGCRSSRTTCCRASAIRPSPSAASIRGRWCSSRTTGRRRRRRPCACSATASRCRCTSTTRCRRRDRPTPGPACCTRRSTFALGSFSVGDAARRLPDRRDDARHLHASDAGGGRGAASCARGDDAARGSRRRAPGVRRRRRRNGTVVVTDNHQVTLSVSGPGSIIGTDDGHHEGRPAGDLGAAGPHGRGRSR